MLSFSLLSSGVLSGVKSLVTACYAHKNTKDPVRIAMICLSLNAILGVVLMQVFAHAGLSLATSLAGYAQVFLLARILRQRYQLPSLFKKVYLPAIVFATVMMSAVLGWVCPDHLVWDHWGVSARLFHLGELLILGIGVYGLVLWGTLRRYVDLKAWVKVS